MDKTPHRPIILSRLRSGTVLTVWFTLTIVLFNNKEEGFLDFRIISEESSAVLQNLLDNNKIQRDLGILETDRP